MFGVARHVIDVIANRTHEIIDARVSMAEQRIAVLLSQQDNRTTVNRETIANTFLKGHGLEIGALHRPLKLPHGTRVSYMDMEPIDVLIKKFPEVSGIMKPDYVGNGEILEGVNDDSFDFIIANHFFEHTENPFGTLKRFAEAVRSGGMIFMAIPDKRWTFDLPRAITPLDHVIRDFIDGPETSRWDHYDEWLRIIDKFQGDELEERRTAFIRDRVNIHFHVWTINEMMEMFIAAKNKLSIPVEIKLAYADPPNLEVVWVLQVTK